jgi:tetratricopeptide (TPR) repeat protein
VERFAAKALAKLREFDPEADFIIDKLPHNFENIGLIKLLFPNAKIISVRRDYRDIALSNYFTDYQAKHGGMGFAYDLAWIRDQLLDHMLLMHHWNQVFPGEILEVRYEDVVEDTEGMARKMLDYIGVAWEPQVLGFDKLDRPVKTASVWQVRQPIYKTSKAKWMRYEQHLGPLIQNGQAEIKIAPITDMAHLPEPGLLIEANRLFEAGDLDAAEYAFKKLLHHVPGHITAQFMVGLIYARKGHVEEAITLVKGCVEKMPWKKTWVSALKDLCRLLPDSPAAVAALTQAEALEAKFAKAAVAEDADVPNLGDFVLGNDESICLPTSLQ